MLGNQAVFCHISDDSQQLPVRRGCCFRNGRSTDNGSAVADAVGRVIPIYIVSIEPQANTGEGICQEIGIANG